MKEMLFYHREEFHFLKNILFSGTFNKNKGNSGLDSINQARINGGASFSLGCFWNIY